MHIVSAAPVRSLSPPSSSRRLLLRMCPCVTRLKRVWLQLVTPSASLGGCDGAVCTVNTANSGLAPARALESPLPDPSVPTASVDRPAPLCRIATLHSKLQTNRAARASRHAVCCPVGSRVPAVQGRRRPRAGRPAPTPKPNRAQEHPLFVAYFRRRASARIPARAPGVSERSISSLAYCTVSVPFTLLNVGFQARTMRGHLQFLSTGGGGDQSAAGVRFLGGA